MPLQKKKSTATESTTKKTTKAAAPAPAATETAAPAAPAVNETVGVEEAITPVDDGAGIRESMCDKLAFVCALGDPSRIDQAVGENARKDPTIVGYVFKVLADMEVPDCGIPKDLVNVKMDYDPEMIFNTRPVKAGEEVALTRFESGMLLAKEEFNNRATGGDIPVTGSFASKEKLVTGDGVATVSAETKLPTFSLKPGKPGVSLKDIAMRPVLTFTDRTVSGQIRKDRQIVPGYEKWESLCKASVARGGNRTASSKTIKRNEKAAAFLQVVNAKAQKAQRAAQNAQ